MSCGGNGDEMTADPETWDTCPERWDEDEKGVLRCRDCGGLHPGQVKAARAAGLLNGKTVA